MRLTYHNLVIELPVEGIKEVESVEITHRLNEHGHTVVRVMNEEVFDNIDFVKGN